MPDHAIITLDGVSFRYPDSEKNAVDDVSLAVEAGEFYAVLGHNGSGKSTLAKLLNALYTPSSGTIFVDGLSATDEKNIWDIRSRCGMVFQNPDNQLVATIVEEDVAFGLENLGVPPGDIRRRVNDALEMVGMLSFAGAAPHMLSGGQKQRIAIAGVLAMRPKVIVFDEATAMLDPSGRKDVMDVVQRLNREEHITIMWITHFMEEAALADRVMVMDEGIIAMEGPPKQVFEQVDTVKSYGLDVPEMVELSRRLRDESIDIQKGILTVEEMVVELCRLKS